MNLRIFFGMMLLGLWSLVIPTASMAVTADVAPQAKPPSVTAVPLSHFMIENKPIELFSSDAEYALSLPLARFEQITNAQLNLKITNSIALLKERSQLVVQVNDHVVAQIALNATEPETQIQIRLPAEYFKPGYNRLRFKASQHYSLGCEEHGAPELWTHIDTEFSTLIWETQRQLLAPHLSELNDLFDPKQQHKQPLIIATAKEMGESELQWGALAAIGVAQRLQYVPLAIKHYPLDHKGTTKTLVSQDQILIGTKDQLIPFLTDDLPEKITDSFIGVYPLPNDSHHFMLVISGLNKEQVNRAVRSFASSQAAFPDVDHMLIKDRVIPIVDDYGRTLQENHLYSFASLGFHSSTSKGQSVSPPQLDFIMPADFYVDENSQFKLLLHFAYGAQMREDSVLNIWLNKQFFNAIPLKQSTGGIFRRYEVLLPARQLLPGNNTISLEPRMIPFVTGQCSLVNSENLLFTLFEDSILELPDALHFATMPNLQLLSLTAFPYNGLQQGKKFWMYVADHESASIASAWMVLSKLSQRGLILNDLPPISFELPSDEQKNKDLIAVGVADGLSEELLKNAPIQPGLLGKVIQPAFLSFSQSSGMNAQWRGLQQIMQKLGLGSVEHPSERSGYTLQSMSLGKFSLVSQFQSPWQMDRTVTLFVADSHERLERGIAELIKPEKWGALSGDVVLWQEQMEPVSRKMGSDYTVGNIGGIDQLGYQLNHHPWIWLSALILLILALAGITLLLLQGFWRTYHPKNNGDDHA